MKIIRLYAAQVTCLVFLLIGITSCKKENSRNSNGPTSVKLYLTDDPSLVFDNVFIDIQKLEVKAEDDSEAKHEDEHESESDDNDRHGNTSGGWTSLNIHPGVYDILKFRNGLDTLFASGSFPAGLDIRKIRITLGTNNSVVFNGHSFPLSLKSDDRFVVLKIKDFGLSFGSSQAMNIWIDIDAGRSIRQKDNGFELRSEIRLFTKEKAGGIEGRVLPASASAVVMAINGADTLSAKPEREGEFKFTGLKGGTYSLLFHATANNYKDTTINNIRVAEREDTHIATVTLHQ